MRLLESPGRGARTSLSTSPSLTHTIGIEKRGKSSQVVLLFWLASLSFTSAPQHFPKNQYGVEFWDGNGLGVEQSFLDFSADQVNVLIC